MALPIRGLLVAGASVLLAAAPPPAVVCPVGQPECPARFAQVRKLFKLDSSSFGRELAARFNPPPPPGPNEVSDAKLGQELDAKYIEAFPDFDRSYSPRSRARAKLLARELTRDAPRLSHEQFVLRVAEITALPHNAHTSIGEDALRKDTPRLPIRAFWFADGLRVLRAKPALADLLGARIDRVDGRPIADVYGGLAKYVGSPEARRRLLLLPVLESPALLKAAGLAAANDSLTLEGVLQNGQPFRREIKAEKRDRSAPVSSTMRLLFPAPSGAAMVSYLKPDAAVPASLKDPQHLFTMDDLAGGGLYIAVTANSDGDAEPLSDFLVTAFERVRREHPRFIVVDMRLNAGGDYTKTYDFARALPGAGGNSRIYVLTSPWTFSAAITTVAALKQAGGSKVTIVGEPVGDGLNFWAEGGAFNLPNSGITAYFTTARHDYARPCTNRRTCFWLNELFPVRVRTLQPAISAPLTFAAYSRGRDPALDAILTRERASR